MSSKTVVVVHINEYYTKKDFVDALSKYGDIETIIMHVDTHIKSDTKTIYAVVTFQTEE